MKGSLFATIITSLGLVGTSLAGSPNQAPGRPNHAKFRLKRDTSSGEELEKRGQTYGPARMTYYIAGQGACGIVNSGSDFIVALNSAQYGGGYPGPNCFRSIVISANGKQVGGQITDECPTCGYGELDLSEGLFTQFAGTGAGIFDATWWFADEGGPAPATTEQRHETTTQKAQDTPTTTATSTSTTATSTASSATTTQTGSTDNGNSVQGVQDPNPGTGNNFNQLNVAFVQLGGVISWSGDLHG